MGLKERLSDSQKKMDEMKAKINAASEKAKEARNMKKEELEESIKYVNGEIDAFNELVDEAFDMKLAETEKKLSDIDSNLDFLVKDTAKTVKGNVEAGKENARLAGESLSRSLNTLKLKASMNVNAAKAKLQEKKTEKDMAKAEDHISDLLDYADRCQEMAVAMALESELTFLEAAAEMADYLEKYGE
ncbi:MAG: hypothetical protein K5634_01465 [Sphaerochaetaceae bacterium]|nr:hypothetical protein [Sphaerochaetaceae bacterium]